jgi:phosphatidylglycerophosphate synthase
MATQVVTITAIILGIRFAPLETLGQWALWLTVILALASAVEYFRSFWVQMGGSPKPSRPPERRPLLEFTETPVLSGAEGPKRDVPTHR